MDNNRISDDAVAFGCSVKISHTERQMLNVLKRSGVNISQLLRNAIRDKYGEMQHSSQEKQLQLLKNKAR